MIRRNWDLALLAVVGFLCTGIVFDERRAGDLPAELVVIMCLPVIVVGAWLIVLILNAIERRLRR